MGASSILRAWRRSKDRWQKSIWVAVTVITVAMFSGGCSLLPMRSLNRFDNAAEESQLHGRLMVAANVSSIPDLAVNGSSVTLIVSKDGRQHVQQVPVVDSKATATVADLLPGLWNVVLRVSDESGQPIYEAEGEVTILPDAVATLELVLRPLPGTLVVSVNPQAHPQLQGAQQGRLYNNPGGYTTMTKEPDGTLTATKVLPAGTYDYSIAFVRSDLLCQGSRLRKPLGYDHHPAWKDNFVAVGSRDRRMRGHRQCGQPAANANRRPTDRHG